MLIYCAHPVGVPTKEEHQLNLALGAQWLKHLINVFENSTFIAPWLTYCAVLDDDNPKHRERGKAMDREILLRCDEIWLLGGRISPGMIEEIDLAHEHDIVVRDFTRWGSRPILNAADVAPKERASICDTIR